MKTMFKQMGALCLALLLLVSAVPHVGAASLTQVDGAISAIHHYLDEKGEPAHPGVVGGEWVVIGKARTGGASDPAYYQNYYDELAEYVVKQDGVLHERKYTEYSRTILALTAIGADPANVKGYDLLAPLADYDKTVWQGPNGAIWALIALDSGNYTLPEGTATIQRYVEKVLADQLSDGGWSIRGRVPADPDMTAMALQALARYRNQPAVERAVERGLTFLSKAQTAEGSFISDVSEKVPSSESCAQVIIALNRLGIALDDPRFVKNGKSALDALLTFQNADGSFRHIHSGTADQMATEQALLALASTWRMEHGMPDVYDMTDVMIHVDTGNKVPQRNPDVQMRPDLGLEYPLTDLDGHFAKKAAEGLASRRIMVGVTPGSFGPDLNMTRAEFATAVVAALGLPRQERPGFDDVVPGSWYAAPVGAAHYYGLVGGTAPGTFSPAATITRQETAVMMARAAELCGLDTTVTNVQADKILSAYRDGASVDKWAERDMAFCVRAGLMGAGNTLRPTDRITRGEIALIIWNLLEQAQLV